MRDESRSLHLERRDGASRCAYCHDPLADDAGVTCAGCGTRLHDDCVVEARCPTLGCARTFVEIAHAQRGGAERHQTESLGSWSLAGGVVLPLLCFAFNEAIAGHAFPLVPAWKFDRVGSWLGQFQAPDVQRPLYPLLAWSLLAFYAAAHRQRAAWIRVGLRGGVVLAALFSLLYLRMVPGALMALMAFGLGLLGLGPYFALVAYWRAARCYAREDPALTDPKAAPPDPACAPWALWGVLGITGAALAIQRMNARWAALPEHDPTCFVATAAARGHPRVVGAEPVRLTGGRVLLVTRQLRALKAFELALAALLPRAHRALRLVYDRVGPPIAARLGPRTATLAWVALLPAQAFAELSLRLVFRSAGRLVARTYRPHGPRSRERCGGSPAATSSATRRAPSSVRWQSS